MEKERGNGGGEDLRRRDEKRERNGGGERKEGGGWKESYIIASINLYVSIGNGRQIPSYSNYNLG